MVYEIALGALDSPIEELTTAWTLAAAGAPTIYPSQCFIDQDFMRVMMQGQRGCCVGNTGEEVVRRIVYNMTGSQEDLSFRFVYALAKCLEGTTGYEIYRRTPGADDGTYPALVAKVIRKYGVPLATLCPNDVTLSPDEFCYQRDIKNIPKEVMEDAKKRRSGADFAVPVSVDGIKQAINYAKANNGGVMILRRIGNTYWTDKNGNTTWDKLKLLPMRPPAKITGGHEEFLYGYDEEPNTGRIRIYWLNHWSKDWADNGRGWEYLDEWLHLIGEIRVVVADVPVVDNFRYRFNKYLKKGDKGPDVVALQHILTLEGCFTYPTFTGNFGDRTFQGVIDLQEKYASEILTPAGLKKGTGFVGDYTIKFLNKKYG